jgi:hypothetical protein
MGVRRSDAKVLRVQSGRELRCGRECGSVQPSSAQLSRGDRERGSAAVQDQRGRPAVKADGVEGGVGSEDWQLLGDHCTVVARVVGDSVTWSWSWGAVWGGVVVGGGGSQGRPQRGVRPSNGPCSAAANDADVI